jgi:F0F1-type ATP synthase assembly protein I
MQATNLKNRTFIAAVSLILGVGVAVGPQSLFKICDQTHGAHMGSYSVCHYTAQAEIGIGIVLALLGVAYFIFSNPNTHIGLTVGIALSAVLAFLVPNVLIGMDADPMMACRTATLPALNILSVAAILFAAGNLLYLSRKISRTALPEGV